jgi:hypothetical protein
MIDKQKEEKIIPWQSANMADCQDFAIFLSPERIFQAYWPTPKNGECV